MKYSLVASLLVQSSVVLAELYNVQIRAPTTEHFRDIVRNTTFDFGCRPVAHPTSDGQFELHALLTEDQIDYLNDQFRTVDDMSVSKGLVRRSAAASAPIGTGDRFKAGTIAPLGLGTKASGSTISSIMSVTEVNSAIQGLANTYGIGAYTLPFKTFNGL
jgi:hypothetical protein